MNLSCRSLWMDTRGAIMVMALFLAIFLVGAMYLVLGVGDALLYRRVMQDGADAGAFAASVIAAKGMNLHAVLNVAMAVTAGILLVLRSAEVLLEILLAILHAMAASIILAPKALPLIAVLTPAEASVERIGDGVEEFVRISHDALDAAHLAVQRGFPLLAEARAVDSMVSHQAYDPPVAAGFVIPLLGASLPEGGRGLPVEKDDVDVLCDRAANALGNRLSNVSSSVPRWLLKALGGAVEKALRLGKRRTCDEAIVESPRAVLRQRSEGSEVWLGHEEFQYRAYSIGRDPHSGTWQTGEKGIRIAQGGRTRGRTRAYESHLVGRVGLAQAEYYFDGTEPKVEWLWKQRWRARLRRFRISRGWMPAAFLGACTGVRRGTFHGDLSHACDLIRDFSINAVSAH